nr:[Fe-Fe] hydrogenase large subunit C-terminal domain-containing protein [Melioribacteraceae bacterium]
MDQNYPIFTANVECQDCYKCVRECPVKAIKVSEGHASIIPELCTACGHCVVTCPVNAKKIRDDIFRLELLLSEKRKVYASIAPSWITNFPNVSKSQIIAALKKLGFTGVSETALGAEEVTAGLSEYLNNAVPGIYISSACPSVVDYIAKHSP